MSKEAMTLALEALENRTSLMKWQKARDAVREALAKQEQGEPVACLVGTKGSAFDSPKTKRAYTYTEQPNNIVAYKLGRACTAASSNLGGDAIDAGLSLLKELQAEGFGVFDLGAEYTTPYVPTGRQPAQKPLTIEQIERAENQIWNTDQLDEVERQANKEFTRAIEAAHGIKENT